MDRSMRPTGLAKESKVLKTQPDVPMKAPPRLYRLQNPIDDPYQYPMGVMPDEKRVPVVGTSTPHPTAPKSDTMLDKPGGD